MNKSPWLQPEHIKLVGLLLDSHEKAFKYKLFNYENRENLNTINSQKLFSLDQVVLAHNNNKDPMIQYANALGLKLWEKTWSEMIGMPSRLTAPKNERKQRNDAIKEAHIKDFLTGYEGIRISSKGNLFHIKNVRIWKICDKENNEYGQAATFSEWDWI